MKPEDKKNLKDQTQITTESKTPLNAKKPEVTVIKVPKKSTTFFPGRSSNFVGTTQVEEQEISAILSAPQNNTNKELLNLTKSGKIKEEIDPFEKEIETIGKKIDVIEKEIKDLKKESNRFLPIILRIKELKFLKSVIKRLEQGYESSQSSPAPSTESTLRTPSTTSIDSTLDSPSSINTSPRSLSYTPTPLNINGNFTSNLNVPPPPPEQSSGVDKIPPPPPPEQSSGVDKIPPPPPPEQSNGVDEIPPPPPPEQPNIHPSQYRVLPKIGEKGSSKDPQIVALSKPDEKPAPIILPKEPQLLSKILNDKFPELKSTSTPTATPAQTPKKSGPDISR